MKDLFDNTILIVDDTPENIDILVELLEDFDKQVAINGNDALETAFENPPDLILLDIMMPEMDGYEVCEKLRADERTKEIPVIFLTAKTEKGDIVKGFEAGGQDYVTKPFDVHELMERVKTHLELKNQREILRNMNEILEKKVAERTEELNIANSKLLQLDSAKSVFLHIISHEIRTPLNGILGGLSILNESQLDEEASEMLRILDVSANRLEDFSVKALDISLLNTEGKEAFRMELTDIYEMVTFQIENAKSNAEAKNISISMTKETDDTHMLVDAGFMQKCISYVLDNAIKYGNKDSQVKITITSSDEHLELSFEDDGLPFPEGYNISRIQPFETKVHVDQNPGLSLFLGKQIIDLHGGKMEVHNTKNGAKVSIIIPKIASKM